MERSPVAEFPLQNVRQAKSMGRRAALLGALVELPRRQREALADAVTEACRLFARAKLPARVQFVLVEDHSPPEIEIVVTAQGLAPEGGTSTVTPEMLDRFRELAGAAGRLEMTEFPGPAASITIGRPIASTARLPGDRERDYWAELLSAETSEDAVAIAHRRGQPVRRPFALERFPGEELGVGDRDHWETLSLVVAHTSNAIIVLDSEGCVQWTNNAFRSLTGYSLSEVKGRRFDEVLFGPSTPREAIREFDQALRNGHPLTQDLLQYHRDGRTVWVECKLMPVQDEGRLTRWVVIESDITRRRQTEEALRAAKQAAESSSRAKSEFLANMSHEIRTPLNAILGMTELALTTDLTREQREYLRTVQTSAETLLQLLNDVLDVSKIEAGKMEIEETDFNLADIVRDTLQTLAVKAHEKDLELAVHMPMDIPQNFRGDPVRIRQVLFNLVGNAIKFTERGEVIVEVERQWQDADEVCLHFSVRDTGIGIPKEKLEQIFEAFHQADSSIARRFGGTGLGLTITAQLLRLMGGRIWVQSQPNKGSNFHFTLRLKLGQQPAAPVTPASAAQLKDKRALVVDDNAANRRILNEILSHWGVQTTLSDGAAAAMKELERAAREGRPFDLVLLDAMMPVIDGFQLAELIRQRADFHCGKVMMLSSVDRPHSAEEFRRIGITTFLVKPVSAGALLEAVLTALGEQQPPQNAWEENNSDSPQKDEPASLAAQPKRSLRILVADDHEPNRSLAMKILERRGHRCTPAADGSEAIDACARETFDIVLMDVQMPGCDGFTATRAIREREQRTGSHVPIVALTAHALRGDREKCLAAGMDAYLAKPIHARELVALVERMTHVSPDGEAPIEEPSATPATPPSGFDFSAALDRMDGEMDLLREHMNYMLNDAPQLVLNMREAVHNNDGRQLEIAAHRLKGLVGSYNYDEARELAAALEIQGKQSQFEGAEAKLDRLEVLMREFSQAVEAFLEQPT